MIKAHLAGSGIIGTGLGVHSPGTAYVLLHHYMGDVDGSIGAWGFARGGMGAVSRALGGAFEAAGGEIRTGAGVERFMVRNNLVTGVALENGDEFQAPIVVSNLDVKRTFLRHLDPGLCPRSSSRACAGSRSAAPRASSTSHSTPCPTSRRHRRSPFLKGDLHCSDSLASLERAYDDWKAGRWSADPYFDLLIPSQIDPTMAPPGKHMATVFVQYAPYELSGGRSWNDETRAAFADTVLAKIGQASPNFRELIVHKEVRTPLDIENEVGLTEGNIFQGELTFDQLLFNRPVPGWARYRSPIQGLYMCGSSNHPGGGVMAAPGANAAREILRDLGKPRTGRAA